MQSSVGESLVKQMCAMQQQHHHHLNIHLMCKGKVWKEDKWGFWNVFHGGSLTPSFEHPIVTPSARIWDDATFVRSLVGCFSGRRFSLLLKKFPLETRAFVSEISPTYFDTEFLSFIFLWIFTFCSNEDDWWPSSLLPLVTLTWLAAISPNYNSTTNTLSFNALNGPVLFRFIVKRHKVWWRPENCQLWWGSAMVAML